MGSLDLGSIIDGVLGDLVSVAGMRPRSRGRRLLRDRYRALADDRGRAWRADIAAMPADERWACRDTAAALRDSGAVVGGPAGVVVDLPPAVERLVGILERLGAEGPAERAERRDWAMGILSDLGACVLLWVDAAGGGLSPADPRAWDILEDADDMSREPIYIGGVPWIESRDGLGGRLAEGGAE